MWTYGISVDRQKGQHELGGPNNLFLCCITIWLKSAEMCHFLCICSQLHCFRTKNKVRCLFTPSFPPVSTFNGSLYKFQLQSDITKSSPLLSLQNSWDHFLQGMTSTYFLLFECHWQDQHLLPMPIALEKVLFNLHHTTISDCPPLLIPTSSVNHTKYYTCSFTSSTPTVQGLSRSSSLQLLIPYTAFGAYKCNLL